MQEQGPPLPTLQIMHQRWSDLCFLHWRIDPTLIADRLPPGCEPDIFDGSAWVGLIPFRMQDAGLFAGPAIPYLGDFLEWNVRVYSRDAAGRRGVVFFSLEAQRSLVVAGARLAFGVPYQWARMSHSEHPAGPESGGGAVIGYDSQRFGRRGPTSRLRLRIGDPVPDPDPLAIFLTARFGLHSRWAGRSWWVPNTHEPWPLRSAEVLELDDELLAAAGLPGVADRAPDSVLFSRGVRTFFGRPLRVRGAGAP